MMKPDEIVLGDCLQIMPQWPDACFDAVITDPPYGVTQDSDDYVATAFLREAYRLLKKDAALMMFVGQKTIREFWNAAEEVGFTWLNTVVWHYRNTIKRERHRFAIQYDPILYFAKGNFKHKMENVRVPYLSTERLKYPVNNAKKTGWTPNPNGAICGDVWEFPAINTTSNNGQDAPCGHKWQKPVAVFDRMIKSTCEKGDFILDPFVGSGTSCIAALQNSVHYMGIENDPNSHKIAIDRLSAPQKINTQEKSKTRDIFADA